MVTQDAETRRRKLRERAEAAEPLSNAPAWAKEDHPTLTGMVVRRSHFGGNVKAGPCDVCVVDDEELGETTVYIRNWNLVEQFKEHDPQVGEWVCLRFLGMLEGSRSSFYHLEVDRDTAANNQAENGVPAFVTEPDD